LPENIINELVKNRLEQIQIKQPGDELTLQYLLNFENYGKKYYENVSNINGIILPMYYEYFTTKTIKSVNILKDIYLNYLDIKNTSDKILKEEKEKNTPDENIFAKELEFIMNIDMQKNINIEDMIKISIYFDAYLTKYIHKTKQIKTFNWITKQNLEKSNERFKSIIGNGAKYEVEVKILNYDNNANILKGFIDCVNGTDVYEFKFTTEIKEEHKLQLCLYIYMFANQKNICSDEELNKYKFYIFNVRFDEKIEIKTTMNNLKFIYDKILDIKLNGYYKRPDDNTFLLNCKNICDEYKNNATDQIIKIKKMK
jgi:hypothetical protein